jgi:DNA topoisomerase IA
MLKKNVFLDTIKTISTKGFINDYIVVNDNVKIIPKNEELINELKEINNEIVVIASDLDEAGDFIAFEILENLNKNNTIFRITVPFDTLLSYNELNEKDLLLVCSNTINFSNAERYWNNYLNKDEKLDYIYGIYTNMYNEDIEI